MPKDVTTAMVRASLREHFASPAHVVLEEVRNQTGYGRRQERFADAVAASVWPSRGLWLAGVEIKVSRYDWVKELKDPTKSVEIQRFCDYWWLAAAPGVVMDGEVPETWGFLEFVPKSRKKNKLRVVKAAPKLEAEQVELAFVCSVLRNVEGHQQETAKAIRAEVEGELREEYGGDALQTVEAKLLVAERELEYEKRQTKRLTKIEEQNAELRRLLGQGWGDEIDEDEALARVKIAQHLADLGLGSVAVRLRALAKATEEVLRA